MSEDATNVATRHNELAIKPSLNTLAQNSMFWQPRYLERSAWLEHLPFLFWLVEALQPRQVVTLGMQQGVPHFAICQGVSRLNLDARCYAIHSWENDQKAKSFDVLKQYNDQEYGTFSQLIDSEPASVLAQFEDASLDLLVLDVPAETRSVGYLFDRWIPKLSPQGVVLIPSVARRDAECEVFRDFETLSTRHPGFVFHHGEGLGVIAAGEHQCAMLRNLLGSNRSPAAQQVVRDVFARLGRTCLDGYTARTQKQWAESLSASMEVQARQLDEVSQSYERICEELEARSQEVSGVKQRLEQQIERHAHERSLLTERINLLQELRDESRAELKALRDKLDAQYRQQVESTQQMLQLQSENAAQAEKLRQQEATLQEWQAQDDTLIHRFTEKDAALKVQALQLDQLRQQLSARDASGQEDTAREEALEQQLAQRDTTISDQQARIAEFEQKLADQQSTLAERNQELTALYGKLEQADTNNQKHQTVSEEAEDVRSMLEASLKHLESEHDALREECDQVYFELAAQQNNLVAQQAQWQQQLEEKDANIATRFDELAKLTEMLEQAGADRRQQQLAFEEVQEARALLEASLAQLESERDMLRKERDQVRFDLAAQQNSFKSQQTQWYQQLGEKDTDMATHFEELARLTDMLDRTGADKQQQQAAFEESEQARALLEKSLTYLESERAALRDELDQARFELEAQQNRLMAQQAEWQQQLEEKDASIATRYEELAKLTDMLEHKEQQLEGLKLRYEPDLVDQEAGKQDGKGARTNKRKQKRDAAELVASGLFDKAWYLKTYPDVAAEKRYARDPALHYLKFGGFEGRNPSEHFDSQWYLNDNPDVAISGLNPLLHYLRYGRREERSPLPR
nr:class I SAM-dependent methyltransferase [uncultured Halomonas sp.]